MELLNERDMIGNQWQEAYKQCQGAQRRYKWAQAKLDAAPPLARAAMNERATMRFNQWLEALAQLDALTDDQRENSHAILESLQSR